MGRVLLVNGVICRSHACARINTQAVPSIGPHLRSRPCAFATSTADGRLRNVLLSLVPDPRHDCTEQEEYYQEPEERMPGVQHVDEGHNDAGRDAAGGELIAEPGVGDEERGACELRDVVLHEAGEDVHDCGMQEIVDLGEIVSTTRGEVWLKTERASGRTTRPSLVGMRQTAEITTIKQRYAGYCAAMLCYVMLCVCLLHDYIA